jgi:hypothetical protein
MTSQILSWAFVIKDHKTSEYLWSLPKAPPHIPQPGNVVVFPGSGKDKARVVRSVWFDYTTATVTIYVNDYQDY